MNESETWPLCKVVAASVAGGAATLAGIYSREAAASRGFDKIPPTVQLSKKTLIGWIAWIGVFVILVTGGGWTMRLAGLSQHTAHREENIILNFYYHPHLKLGFIS